MTFRQIFNRARRDTQLLRWKEELAAVVVIGGSTYVALRLSGEGARAEVIALIASVVALALMLLAELVWNFALAPARILESGLSSLSERVERLDEKLKRLDVSPAPLRVALYAVRSELAACAIRIHEARERKAWWNPAQHPLPGSAWREHFATLADPGLRSPLHAQIEHAYQDCDVLNRRIERYIDEHRQSQVIAFPQGLPSSVLRFREGDEDLLRGVERRIREANSAITIYVDVALASAKRS